MSDSQELFETKKQKTSKMPEYEIHAILLVYY